MIEWNNELYEHFSRAQQSLKSPQIITIPRPSDSLIITTDGSPVNKGLGATLFSVRNGKRLVSGFFSVKLKSHQEKWYPCEFEALAISAAIEHFGPILASLVCRLLASCARGNFLLLLEFLPF